MDRETLGQLIRQTRVARGWTQKELGARAGVSQAMVWKIEMGKGGVPESYEKIAGALGGRFDSQLLFDSDIEINSVVAALLDAARAVPLERAAAATRWLRLLPHLPERVLRVKLEEVAIWEEQLGLEPPS